MACLCTYGVTFLLGFIFHAYLPDLRHRYFAWFIDRFTRQSSPAMKAFKEEALKGVREVAGREGGAPRILEIGVGTGANFQFFPSDCHLTVIDPNPHFKSYYDENRAKFSNIKSEEIIVGFGEDMDMVADGSVDAVVVTLVLCSVRDVEKVVSQVKRVLASGGKFFFVEHVRDWDVKSGTRRFFQDLLTVTGVWPFFLDGCMLNRESHLQIERAGFTTVDYDKKYAPMDSFIFQLVSPMVTGVAVK